MTRLELNDQECDVVIVALDEYRKRTTTTGHSTIPFHDQVHRDVAANVADYIANTREGR